MRTWISVAGLSTALLGLAAAQNSGPRDVLVFERPSNQWFEGPLTPVSVSQNGDWALFASFEDTHIYSLPGGREDDTVLRASLGSIQYAVFCGSGSPGLARLGRRGSEKGWFLPEGETQQLSALPARATPACSADGREIAYFTKRGLFVGGRAEPRNYAVKETVTAMGFSPDGEIFYYLAQEPNGESSLFGIHVQTGELRNIVSHLDGSQYGGPISVSPDGKRAYLALASDGAPDNEARHKPNADRWLKIYRIDLATGERRRIVDSPGEDNSDPIVANGNLYWTRTVVHNSIVTLPVGGGRSRN